LRSLALIEDAEFFILTQHSFCGEAILVVQPLHPAAETARGLVYAAGIIALVFGAIMVVLGVVLLKFIVGLIPLIFGLVDLIIYSECRDIMRLIDERRYGEAESKTLTWMIVGFVVGGTHTRRTAAGSLRKARRSTHNTDAYTGLGRAAKSFFTYFQR